MKKILVCLSLILVAFNAHAAKYYFSATGNDNNSGTQASPYKTLSKLNTLFTTALPGDSFLLRRGDVFYGQVVVGKSGTESNPIGIGAWGIGAKPVITGFTTLNPSKWVSKGNGVYANYDSSMDAKVRVVTVNGYYKEMGRYPNDDNTSFGGGLSYEDHLSYTDKNGKTQTNGIVDNELGSLSGSTNWSGAEIVLKTVQFEISHLGIQTHNGNSILFTDRTYQPVTSNTHGNYGYYITNDIKTLDKAFEWSYDDENGDVLNMHFGGANPINNSAFVVKVSSLDTLVSASNKSYWGIRDIEIQGSNGNGIILTGTCNGFRLENCNVDYCGTDAILDKSDRGTSKSGNMYYGNYVHHNNNSSIKISTAGYDTIRYNTVDSTGMFLSALSSGKTGNGIDLSLISKSNDILVDSNIVKNSGDVGIIFNNGKNNKLYYNVINGYAKYITDVGGIYSYGGTAQDSLTISTYRSSGRIIDHNLILNGNPGTYLQKYGSITSAIYPDNMSSDIIVSNNTVFNAPLNGVHQNGGKNISYINNLFYGVSSGLFLRSLRSTWHMTQCKAVNNVFVLTTTGKIGLQYRDENNEDKLGIFGKIDSNIYSKPIGELDNPGSSSSYDVVKTSGFTGGAGYTLAQWKLGYGSAFDQHAKKTANNATVSNLSTDIRVIYNPTMKDSTINLHDTTWIDATGKSFITGYTVLSAASGNVLIRTPNIKVVSNPTNPNSPTGGSVDIDSIVPTVSLTQPIGGAVFTSPATVSFAANASDENGIDRVEFYNTTTILLGTDSIAPYTFDWTNVSPGTYNIYAKAYDPTNNRKTSTPIRVTVNAPVITPLQNLIRIKRKGKFKSFTQ